MNTADANRAFYRARAASYDASEVAVCGKRQQARLRAALAQALRLANPNPVALDACGGSGNVASALVQSGIVPVLVDVSPEMVELWLAKARAAGLEPETHVQPIESFLRADGRAWDLITFSSALHHLDDCAGVLELAATRLAPRGVIMTIFDPTPGGRGIRLLRKADWALHLLVTEPREFARLARSTLTRGSPRDDQEAYVGRLAERYAYAGVDDHELRRRLEALGLTVVVHERYVDSRLAVIAALLRAIRRPSHFQLIAQRPR